MLGNSFTASKYLKKAKFALEVTEKSKSLLSDFIKDPSTTEVHLPTINDTFTFQHNSLQTLEKTENSEESEISLK